jgi:nitroreductase
MNLIDLLNWRYATKKMDPTKAVPQDKVDRIVEATRLSASSSGLQPYELLVVTNPELRQKIQAAAHNQAQITEGSHLLVFATWDNYTRERIMAMFDLMAAERGGYSETAVAYRDRLLESTLAWAPP